MQSTSILILLVAAFAAVAESRTLNSYCSLSGDPHYTTFDGVRHDFQGDGVFELIKSPHVTVQSQFVRCNLKAKKWVACVRKTWIELEGIGAVHYGRWGSKIDDLTFVPLNPRESTIVRTHSELTTTPLLIGKDYKITWDKKKGRVVVESPEMQTKFIMGRAYFYANFPRNDMFMGVTNGLCGCFDGAAGNDFVHRADPVGRETSDFCNGRDAAFATKAKSRYNSPRFPVNAWGATFAVNGSDVNGIKPIAQTFHHWREQSDGRFELQAEATLPIAHVPTDEDSGVADIVTFENLDDMTVAQELCRKVTESEMAYEDCMFDAAALGADSLVAASNGAAEDTINTDLPPADKTFVEENVGLIIGLSVGLSIALIMAIAAALVFRQRFHKSQDDYNRALIVHQGGNSDAGANDHANSTSINVADNL